jgi:hypothetical protein
MAAMYSMNFITQDDIMKRMASLMVAGKREKKFQILRG